MTLDERYDIAAEIMEMDYEMRNYEGDEDIIMYWLQEGVEDHLTNWEVEDYLDYVNEYADLVDAYQECQKMIEEDC